MLKRILFYDIILTILRLKKGENRMKKEYICAGGAIILWSTLAASAKILFGTYSDTQLLCASSLFAFLSLVILNLVTGKMKLIRDFSPKDILTMAAVGLPGVFLYYIFYYAGAERLPASQAFIINYMWPVMSIVFAIIILKEKLTARKAVAILLSFVGVVFVAGEGILSFEDGAISGFILCFMGAVSYGLFTALSKKTGYDSSFAMMINCLVSFLLTLVIVLIENDPFVVTAGGILGLIWNGVFTLAIPNTLWVIAVSRGNTAKIANLAYITPFLSMLWTSLLLKESVSLFSVIGLVIMVGGILIQLSSKGE